MTVVYNVIKHAIGHLEFCRRLGSSRTSPETWGG